jgi:prepilin-type N-terminal cleavage/methylation domain-containing protein
LPRPAFTLVELLVVISIILVLMGLIGSAVSAARGSQRVQATQALIAKIERVVQQHYSSYASRPVPATLLTGTSPITAAHRATYLRRLASAELPDNWADVRAIATGTVLAFGSGTTFLPRTAPQNAYIGLLASSTVAPTDQFADAECLFMIVMMGGVADCVDCGSLQSVKIGDQDTDAQGNVVGDGMPEFLDAWNNPIRFVLWPAGLKLPASGAANFFSSTAPFYSDPSIATAGRTMRPLIFSCGPDGNKLMKRPPNDTPGPSLLLTNPIGNLANGANCGTPSGGSQSGQTPGSPIWRSSPDDELPDNNITNFDAEARK